MRLVYLSLAFFVFLAVLGLVYAVVPSLGGWWTGNSRKGMYHDGTLLIRDVSFEVEIADTFLARTNGLSGREDLPVEKGMLFIFSESGRHGFWMKGMRFPIDIVWIKDGRVVGISENLLPARNQEKLMVYYPPEPVDHVLEIRAGAVAAYGFISGDEARLVWNER